MRSERALEAELDIELTQLDALSAQLEHVVKKLEAIGKDDPRNKRIRNHTWCRTSHS